MASWQPGFSIWLGILAVAGVVVGHLGINLFDDYFGHYAVIILAVSHVDEYGGGLFG
jgi:hypothetical protein